MEHSLGDEPIAFAVGVIPIGGQAIGAALKDVEGRHHGDARKAEGRFGREVVPLEDHGGAETSGPGLAG